MSFTLNNLPKYYDGSHKIDPSDGHAILKASHNPKKLLHPEIKTGKDQQTLFFILQTCATISLAGYGAAIDNIATLETGLKNTGKNILGVVSKFIQNIKRDSLIGQLLNATGITTERTQAFIHAAGIWSNSPQAFENVEIKDFPNLLTKTPTKDIAEAQTGYSAVGMYGAFTSTPLIQFNANAIFLEADYNKRVIDKALEQYPKEKKAQLTKYYQDTYEVPIVKAMIQDSSKREKNANRYRILKNTSLLVGGTFGTVRGLAFQGKNSVNQMIDALDGQKENIIIFGTALGILAGAIFTVSATKVAYGALTKVENKKPKLGEIERELDPDDIAYTMQVFDQELEWIIKNPKAQEGNSTSKKLEL